MRHSDVYLQRYAYPQEFLKNEPVTDNLGMVVVIPSYKEENIIPTLESLDYCDLPDNNVEVILVVNQPENCSVEDEGKNKLTLQQFTDFKKHSSNPKIRYHVIYADDLPQKHAGVGLARKIGMDEAVRRFDKAGNSQGVIINYDADCTCSKNYLQRIEKTFKNPDVIGASIYFEHIIRDNTDQHLAKGIIEYELHLRYLVHALRYSGFPFAFHTVGSCMAVRSDVYQHQGGMNRRKAGEDFYFLQKIFPLGNFMEINDATVMPSIRTSDRVPFGTGRAMTEWEKDHSVQYMTYSPESFMNLKQVLNNIDGCYTLSSSGIKKRYESSPLTFRDFVSVNEYTDKVSSCQQNSASAETFRQKFFSWMNGLKVLKYIHHCRDNCYPDIPVEEAVQWALNEILEEKVKAGSTEDILEQFRKYDRNNAVRSDRKGRICPVSVPL